jgi:hypothetical protein
LFAVIEFRNGLILVLLWRAQREKRSETGSDAERLRLVPLGTGTKVTEQFTSQPNKRDYSLLHEMTAVMNLQSFKDSSVRVICMHK